MLEEGEPTTLYVGSLDANVSTELLTGLFCQAGPLKGCKVVREPAHSPYALVDFEDHASARAALAWHGRPLLGREMRVNWASTPANQREAHHVFVGDLGPDVDSHALRQAFSPFGEVSSCRVVRDPHTLKSRGYAFVSFTKRSEAEKAILGMNGQWVGGRCIRTNWSTRKARPRPRHTVDELSAQTSPSNTTVYLGNVPDISDQLVQQIFSQFGPIHSVRVFKDKGYAFVKFAAKESAAEAIHALDKSEVNGRQVKCFWGKEWGGRSTFPACPNYPSYPTYPTCPTYPTYPCLVTYPLAYPSFPYDLPDNYHQ